MSYSDDDLRSAVDAVFDIYDKDKSGSLDSNEIGQFMNDLLKEIGSNKQATQEEIN